MAPILEMEVECGEQKSRLLRGMVVLRGTVNYCNPHDRKGGGLVVLFSQLREVTLFF